jgi:hypothetical protein
MTRHGDEFGDMNEVPLARPTPIGHDGSGAEVAQFLAELRALGQCAAPTPSPELTALLGRARMVRPRALRVLARTAAAVAAGVAASVIAAANHDLPAPAQRVVSNVVNVLTPFHIDPPKHAPAPLPSPRRSADRDDSGTSPEREHSDESASESDDQPPRSAETSESDAPSGSDGAPQSDEGSRSAESHDSGGGTTDPAGEPAGTGDGGTGAGNDQ